jgi:hypothetical protein
MSGVVQSEQTTCHSHGTSLFPWWQTTLAWKQDSRWWYQVLVGAVHTCWREVREVMTQSQWRLGRLGIQIEIRAFCKKNWIYDYRVNRALSMLRCCTILWYVWCIHLNGICWNSYPSKMQIFET